MTISTLHITKSFGTTTVLRDVSITADQGSIVALLGPSGSGKTTLLRILAGVEVADSGSVSYEGREITHHPPQQRNMSLVFQHYALFRHMTVFENIAFPLRVRKKEKTYIKSRVYELLALVHLEGFAQYQPSQLSGGQRQRVALARALAADPGVLLLDEPFGALDSQVRRELRRWLRQLHDQTDVTTILVTHDQQEAIDVADQLVVINAGRIEQQGTPRDVFAAPASEFVATFLDITPATAQPLRPQLRAGVATNLLRTKNIHSA
jgi:sulfate/thiosulfate transport system ATP-binding protein